LYGAKHEFTDNIGNVAYSIGHGSIPFMVSGHIDEIALQVQYIDDKGFIHFIKDGGSDPKIMPGTAVKILTNGGKSQVFGVIGKTPIHIEFHGDKKDKAAKIKELKIDVGAKNKNEVMKYVSVGDPIVFVHPIYELMSNRIACGGIDDKVGVYVTAMVLKKFKDLEATSPLKNIKLYGVACTQEEVGGNGATIASKRINPAYSIDYDVTFATDDDYVSPNEWGNIKLGKGGAIAHGVNNNQNFTKLITNTCKELNIPYQEFVAPSGGTDTIYIKQSSSDCATQLLSIPNRNMHTQVEMCDYRDLQSLIDMTVATIIRINDLNV
jgi:endoglucanase